MKKVTLAMVFMLASAMASAQYTFSVSMSVSGPCAGIGGSVATQSVRSWIEHVNQQMHAVPLSREECMAMNQQIRAEGLTMNFEEYGCKITITVTPCSCAGCSAVDEVSPVQPGQGGSFHSSNLAREVQEWQADENRRYEVLGGEDRQQSSSLTNTLRIDADRAFRSINIDEKGGMLGSSSDLNIIQRLDRMDAAIDRTPEKQEMDAAILANDVYGTDTNNWIGMTNYTRLSLSPLPAEHRAMQSIADAIMLCNQTTGITGFHAEMYYNDKTGKYVISIAGSDDAEDWLYNNLPNLANLEIPQYNLALSIAEALNALPADVRASLDIEIVGHSLGGGVASVIGLATGLETRTFNAARVPDSFIEAHGLGGNSTDNITAYHTSTDVLTNAQQAIGTPALGVSVDVGNPATLGETAMSTTIGATAGSMAGAVVGGVAGVAAGAAIGSTLGPMAAGHSMGPMTRGIIATNTEKAWQKWLEIRSQGVNGDTQGGVIIITE